MKIVRISTSVKIPVKHCVILSTAVFKNDNPWLAVYVQLMAYTILYCMKLPVLRQIAIAHKQQLLQVVVFCSYSNTWNGVPRGPNRHSHLPGQEDQNLYSNHQGSQQVYTYMYMYVHMYVGTLLPTVM